MLIRTILFTTLFLLTAFSLKAQSDELLQTIAKESCECIGKKDVKSISEEQLQMELGMCMMESFGKHGAEIDFDMTDQAAMQKMGEKIGFKMVAICPGVMMTLATTEVKSAQAKQIVSGTVKAIEGKELSLVVLEEADGSTLKLVWLGKFPGDEQLINDPKSVIGKVVEVEVEEKEYYSPQTKSYVQRKEIKALRLK